MSGSRIKIRFDTIIDMLRNHVFYDPMECYGRYIKLGRVDTIGGMRVNSSSMDFTNYEINGFVDDSVDDSGDIRSYPVLWTPITSPNRKLLN